jgi:hypothetical protein
VNAVESGSISVDFIEDLSGKAVWKELETNEVKFVNAVERVYQFERVYQLRFSSLRVFDSSSLRVFDSSSLRVFDSSSLD